MGCYPRFDYGTIVPYAVADSPHNGFAHGGAEALSIYCSAPMTVAGDGFQAKGRLTAGQKFHTAITNQYSFSPTGDQVDAGLLDEELAPFVASPPVPRSTLPPDLPSLRDMMEGLLQFAETTGTKKSREGPE